MDKKDTIYPYNEIFVNKKEWNTDTCYNMNEPWKKPDTKGHILYDSIYMKCPE